MFHVNIRSLNCHCRQLCQFLQLLCINFDVIVLSEIWSYNIDFYSHVLPDYNFYYDLPDSTKIGGVGVFISKNLDLHLLPHYKIVSSNANKTENMWFEVTKNKKKYIMGGIYRHPNQSKKVFLHCMDELLAVVASRHLTCIIAGDINIDLTKCDVNSDTAEYIDMLISNNFMPLLVLPTRITCNTATLIDHIYYFDGADDKELITIKSGNLLEDITDHLPSYALIIRKKKLKNSNRSMVRIFSSKNINEFVGRLEAVEWNPVLGETDVNASFNKFIEIIQNTFNECFHFVKISRKRANDKKWITSSLRRSSAIKNKLYKCWLVTKSPNDESKYKQYHKVFKQTALAAEKLYYKEMFDAKSNSVKQLWHNLNEIASFKERKSFSSNISQLKNSKNEIVTDSKVISNELNQYFSTIGAKLVEDLMRNNTLSNSHRVYCKNFVKNSIFCDPGHKLELKK